MTTKMTTESISTPVEFRMKGLTTFVLILLATMALIAIAVYSQAPIGKTATGGFVSGETFATNGKLILGHCATIGSKASIAPNRATILGSRGGVGPAWRHGPKVSVAHPPVTEVCQPILQASP